MREELIATYYYGSVVEMNDTLFEVVAYYDTAEDYKNRTVSYYDVLDKAGRCMNKGESLTAMPTWDFVRSHFYERV